MRAVISSLNLALGSYQARTDNDIAIAFSIRDGTRLKLNDELDVNLRDLLHSQELVLKRTGQVVAVKLRDIDLHDLRLPSGHGTSRVPSESRLSEASNPSVEARPNGKEARPLAGVAYHPSSERAPLPSAPPHLER